MHGVAAQALEWVRVSERRVAEAEARAESVRAEVKELAMGTLRDVSSEARTRIAAERGTRRQAEAKLAGLQASVSGAESGPRPGRAGLRAGAGGHRPGA